MNLLEIKEKLIEISTFFYQDKIQEGMVLFMPVMEMVVKIPEFAPCIEPLFTALEKKDYVLVADIFYHEMASSVVEEGVEE